MNLQFNVIKDAVAAQFERMQAGGNHLYKVDVSKDEMWDTYLSGFPEGSNPIFRERRDHDCQCCKQFIRLIGNVVAIVDGERVSVWDTTLDLGPYYNAVCMAMSKLMRDAAIVRPFFHYDSSAGTAKSHGQSPDGEVEAWEHFYVDLPHSCMEAKANIDSRIGKIRATKEVFERGLREISFDALNMVLELIEQKSLYRGEEHRDTIKSFLGFKTAYERVPSTEGKTLFCWSVARSNQIGVARLRNTSIGTLLVDLSEGKPLDAAVGTFEAMVAPANYKRPKALITQSMIDRAQKDVEELGYTDALPRRFAVTEDISVTNVLYADRDARVTMKDGAFDLLSASKAISLQSLSKVEEVDIDTFLTDILPHATTLEILMENRHQGNLMSLVAPMDAEAKNMLKWDNNFSWTYNGEVADSMKERVKAAGGKVDGVLRYSLQWNESGQNNNDFDAHCIEPTGGSHIYFQNKERVHASSGRLDVDIVSPNGKVAVENITWTDERKMREGTYQFNVHNYSGSRSKEGFSCEIEYGGEIHSFEYAKVLAGGETVKVATIEYSHATGVRFKEMLPSTVASKELWGVNTMQYTKVAMVMNSPNHWDGNATGNRHMFFILEGCLQAGEVRGFYNEFLSNELNDHRKVFEMLGTRMRVAASDNQLSGLGFSSTQRNHVFCKVTGSFNHIIKITF